MSAPLSRRAVLGGLIALGATPVVALVAGQPFVAPPARPEDLRLRAVPELDEILAKANLTGRVDFALADVATGTVIAERGAQTPLPPASTAKALTALYALRTLGPEHRFHTRILATGPVENGVVQGDLILLGGGDPALDTGALDALAARLAEQGITGITGAFRASAGALGVIRRIDPEQPEWVSYDPAIAGLNLNFNRVHFEWRRASGSYDLAMTARAEGFDPRSYATTMRVAARDLPLFARAEGTAQDAWSVASTALGAKGARWLPVRVPVAYAADVFQTLARARGLPLPTPVVEQGTPEGQELTRHSSPTLSELVRGMLEYSTNLTAEVIGLAATQARGGDISSLEVSAAQLSDWAHETLGAQSVDLKDHSGLNGASRISARDLMRVMLSETDGLLHDHLKHIALEDAPELDVRAKTGTLNFVTGLTGYLTTDTGRQLAFAIQAADVPRREALPVRQRGNPPGGADWTEAARELTFDLLGRWGAVYA